MTYGPARIRFERRKRRRQRQLANAGFWNVLTVLFSIGTVLMGAWFVWFLFLKGSTDNSKPGITQSPVLTSQQEVYPLESPTIKKPNSTSTFLPTQNSFEVPDENISYTFDLQAEPQMISAALFRADRKCNWMGVAGQVFDLQGRPVPGITVQVTGPLYGKEIRFLSLTGAAPWYGAGGYEVFLSDKPFDSEDQFQVRLVDQNGKALSPRISFNTNSQCEKNQVIVNFRQIK